MKRNLNQAMASLLPGLPVLFVVLVLGAFGRFLGFALRALP